MLQRKGDYILHTIFFALLCVNLSALWLILAANLTTELKEGTEFTESKILYCL